MSYIFGAKRYRAAVLAAVAIVSLCYAENLFAAEAIVKNARERAAIEQVIGVYVDGHRQGQSAVMKPAFHQAAIIFLGPKSDPVQLLFDLTDAQKPAAEIAHEVVSIDVSETIGMARVELFNCYGARYTDMFTFVKTEDGWKITCKVSYRHQ